MASRGETETSALIKNLEEQLCRLMQQLEDLDECKDDLENEEYEETRAETIEQLSEFNESLTKMKEGNLSLVNHVNRLQLAIQAAISEGFKTPEVIKMFGRKQPGLLRQKLAEVERDAKLGQLPADLAVQQKLEILVTLKKLGDHLSEQERAYMEANSSETMNNFHIVSENIEGASIVAKARSDVHNATK